jgi:6-phosphofructokinase 1
MAALRATDIVLVDLADATAELKLVPEGLYREAEVFFG